MKINIIPYIEVDGIRTATDTKIRELYQKTVEDGSDTTVFRGDFITNEDSFLIMAKQSGFFLLWYVDGKVAGYSWVDSFIHRTASAHFCSFKWFRKTGTGDEGVKQSLIMWLGLKRLDGSYLFDVILGLPSQKNIHVINLLKRGGYQFRGVIPNGVWNRAEQESEPCEIFTVTREDLL